MTEEKPKYPSKVVEPGSFEPDNHYYPKVINANLSYMVANFFDLGNERIASRYCHLNPSTDKKKLLEMLEYKPKFFKWAGADLFNVVSNKGDRKMTLIETNSCPSGMKSMPLVNELDEQGGYQRLVNHTLKPYIQEQQTLGNCCEGALAVVYDKNPMEACGYACCLADAFKEKVYTVEWYHYDKNPSVRINKDKIMEILDDGKWIPIRAAFRYVTQKPWSRIHLSGTKTLIFNPIIACLAGGRNKLIAAKAYDFFNSEMQMYGLQVNSPKTFQDVEKPLIPLWIKTLGGVAVIKNPYSNAGQGVWTITSKEELKEFMDLKYEYDQFIVQDLIGNREWSSESKLGRFYHVGTVPDKKNKIYVADLRFMIHYSYTLGGFSPVSLYARRAKIPLEEKPPKNSWDALGTNLSVKKEDGTWDTDTKRLIICAQGSFNKLGLGTDDLINGYIQTVLSVVAIDKLACQLFKNDEFQSDIFKSLNKDNSLIEEILL